MISIIALYVILAVILVIFILLHFYVKAYVVLKNGYYHIEIRYLFFKLFELASDTKKSDSEEKKKKKQKNDYSKRNKPLQCDSKQSDTENKKPEAMESVTQSDEKDDACRHSGSKADEKIPDAYNGDNSDDAVREEDDSESGNKSLTAKWNEIKQYIPLAKKTLRKIFKAIRIDDIYLNLSVGKTDAYESAMNYGKVSAAVYNALALFMNVFRCGVKNINVNCLFNVDKTDYEALFVVKVRPSTVIALAAVIGVNFLNIRRKQKKIKLKEKNYEQQQS